MSKPENLRSKLRRAVRQADRVLTSPRVLLTCSAARQLDAACVTEFSIPSILLMEHASLGIAWIVRRACEGIATGVLVLAGPGNNGGDGLACARHLHGTIPGIVSVVLVAARERLQGDAAANLRMAESLGVRLLDGGSNPDTVIRREAARRGSPLLIVDALLGTGLSRPASGPILQAIASCNQLRNSRPDLAVLVVDVPSGLNADTGLPPPGGEAILADATVTMAGLKPGLIGAPGRRWAGTVGVVSIGAPPKLLLRLGKADSQSGGSAPGAASRRGTRG